MDAPPTGPTNGLALLIRERVKQLPGSAPDGSMTVADLIRKTGLPATTVYAYARGDIVGARLTSAVREKLGKIAKALGLTEQQLIAVARDGEPDYEAQLLHLFRRLGSDPQRRQAILLMNQFVNAGRSSR